MLFSIAQSYGKGTHAAGSTRLDKLIALNHWDTSSWEALNGRPLRRRILVKGREGALLSRPSLFPLTSAASPLTVGAARAWGHPDKHILNMSLAQYLHHPRAYNFLTYHKTK